jgi:hypothetical protein
MKNILIFSLLALGALLLSGCQLFEANVKPTANVSAVNVSLDGKTIDKVQSFAGDVKATITKLPMGQQEVKLKSNGFWDFLGGFGVWFLIGGLFLLTAVIAAFFFKAFSVAWSSGLSGAVVLAGAFFLKLFWVWIAWAVALLVIAGAAYELWRYRKKLLPKKTIPTTATAQPPLTK